MDSRRAFTRHRWVLAENHISNPDFQHHFEKGEQGFKLWFMYMLVGLGRMADLVLVRATAGLGLGLGRSS